MQCYTTTTKSLNLCQDGRRRQCLELAVLIFDKEKFTISVEKFQNLFTSAFSSFCNDRTTDFNVIIKIKTCSIAKLLALG